MRSLRARSMHFGSTFRWLTPLFALALLGQEIPSEAQSPSAVFSVQEDWELVVGDPDPVSNAPQVTCVISPVGHVDSLHAAFELNHQTEPAYEAGGLQLQVWEGEEHLNTKWFLEHNQLGTADEVVQWTQQLVLSGGELTFEVTSGESTTWGSFGGKLRTTVGSTLANLDEYDPAVSVANSGVGFAGNRVVSLVLKRVRWYAADGTLLAEDNTPRVVHQHQ